MTLVMAAYLWRTNAELIAHVAKLGYIKLDDHVLDPTYGRGKWWDEFRPHHLTHHDIVQDGMDFRDMPYDANTFDVIAFDPPYVSTGGRTTTTMHDFQNRYGMGDAPRTPALCQELIDDGLTEMNRLCKPGGFILAKTQDYISSGKFWDGTYRTEKHAKETLKLIQHERFEHLSKKGRAQPKHTRQVHARRNLSTLFVFQKPKEKRR